MAKVIFEPDHNLASLTGYTSPTFGPVTSGVNVQFTTTNKAGSPAVTLQTSTDGNIWDNVRDTSGTWLNGLQVGNGFLYSIRTFGRYFRVKGSANGSGGTLDQITIQHD